MPFATVDYRLSRVSGLTSCHSKTRPSKQAWSLIGETEAVDLLFLTGLSAMSARNKNWRRDPGKLVFELRNGVSPVSFIYCAFRVLPYSSSRGTPLVLVLY